MADLAHDASDPASSEPAGITQQVKQPASSDRGKLRVFVSYSREDLKFADQLEAALKLCGFECYLDRHDISGGEDWKRRLGNLISEADTVVFVLSPGSARSPICDWEGAEAARLNKRILPVNCRPLDGASPPSRLRELNYIFFYEEPKATGSGFGTGLVSLVAALNTDFDWLRAHTRYLQRAIEWDTGGRPSDRLLLGNDILEAKAWEARRPKDPQPTALQLEFIRASEEEAEARLAQQRKELENRKQIEAIASAQAARETAQAGREAALQEAEKALKQAADAQRKRARTRNIALIVVSFLAALVGWLAWTVAEQRNLAEAERSRAEEIRSQAETQQHMVTEISEILRRATSIIVSLQKRMDIAQIDIETKNATLALFQDAGRYDEALRLEEAFAAKVEADETKRKGKPGDETAGELNSVARYALFAKEFTKALAVVNRAHALFPDDLWIETNRAHALMFMGHDEQAKALYLAHKGETSQSDKLWKQSIARDFADFRKAGLTSPMMDDIEKELGISR